MKRLIEVYTEDLHPRLSQELKLSNRYAVPAVKKVVLNVGLNLARLDQKKIDQIEKIVATIAGQIPALKRARKAVASFKLRSGDPVALSLTLRGKRMYDFLERLTRIALPRVRDFRGISRKGFDGSGNLSIGLRELSVFPEIRYEDLDVVHGIEITVVTTATTDRAGDKLLSGLGFPLAGERRVSNREG